VTLSSGGEDDVPLRPGGVERTSNRYDHKSIEARWQARWKADGLFEVDVESVDAEKKFYNLVEFPYPSAEGLHVGHAYTYSGADTYGRYLRMRGREVFQPMGFDSFGIHTENFALRVGENPRTLTARTVQNYRRQLRSLGAGFDWSREIVTSDPSYYRFTQWAFVKLYRAGLAERRRAPVVWCPSCLTVLAREQLEGDRCERCWSAVSMRVMDQWFLRMTAYADQLLEGLDELDWPDSAKRVQREWIGRTEGTEVRFAVPDRDLQLVAFTTRSDTLFGVTFMAVAPESSVLWALVGGTQREEAVRRFVDAALTDRVASSAKRPGAPRGIDTGVEAVHPATGMRIPVWVADYVVTGYGTGVVMGVPAHDHRDFEFAASNGLPVMRVVEAPPDHEGPFTGEGTVVDSGPFSGMASTRAREAVTRWLRERGAGGPALSYRLQDWLISRQRYWGPPIPVLYCEGCGVVPVPEEQLPVLLPDVEEFRPTGTAASPLAAVEAFVHASCPTCGGPARRETDVSDTFLDSAWYFLRYPSSDMDRVPWDPERTARMLPVDVYAGGPEHVARHHLYARFVTRALHDMGLVPFAEPFPRLLLHGMLTKDGHKMSKSRGNVVNPDRYVERVGADVLRASLLFCGPWERGGDFTDAGVSGIERFLGRTWRLFAPGPPTGPGGSDIRPLHRAVADVGRHLEHMEFNTAISSLMELVRWATRERHHMSSAEWDSAASTVVRLLAPFVPHIAEELWERIGGEYSVHRQPWPSHDPTAIVPEEVVVAVQVNGRLRARVTVRAGSDRDAVLAAAIREPNVRRHLQGRDPREVVYVPNRLMNLLQ
jgi:leucyl-tRNA synthetase